MSLFSRKKPVEPLRDHEGRYVSRDRLKRIETAVKLASSMQRDDLVERLEAVR